MIRQKTRAEAWQVKWMFVLRRRTGRNSGGTQLSPTQRPLRACRPDTFRKQPCTRRWQETHARVIGGWLWSSPNEGRDADFSTLHSHGLMAHQGLPHVGSSVMRLATRNTNNGHRCRRDLAPHPSHRYRLEIPLDLKNEDLTAMHTLMLKSPQPASPQPPSATGLSSSS